MASVADTAIQYGLSQIGLPYRTSAEFTSACYYAAGVKIPRTGLAQAFRAGQEVLNPRRNLAPGDLVFPTTRVAQLYIGGGYCLTVSPKKGVVKASVRRIWRAVRVTTPGGGSGLALAMAGESSPKPLAGNWRQGLR